ncbi:hypothetical protein BVX98_04100 [bacterium F11]|nr:hypothetical protein BVX98_04100 [bacterium F11]
MKAIILVGGFGTRLRPLTLHQPKPLLPIFNRPFVSYQLDALKKGGVTDVVFALGYKANMWQRTLKKLVPSGMRVSMAIEKTPLGTGGAIRFAYEKLRNRGKSWDNEPVAVLNGDIFLNLDLPKFVSFHQKKKSHISVALTHKENVTNFGLVKFDRNGKITQFLEKPNQSKPGFINAGAYLFNSSLIQGIPKRSCSVEREVFPGHLKKGTPMYGYLLKGYWNDIGTPQTYLGAHLELIRLKNHWTQREFFRKRGIQKGSGVWLGRSVSLGRYALIGDQSKIGNNVSLKGTVCVGKNVRIDDDCIIEDSVIFDHCRIDKGAQIRKTVIGRKCRVGVGVVIKEGSFLGEETILTPFSKV